MEETVKMQEEPVVLQEETPAVCPETDEMAEIAAQPAVEPAGEAAEQPAPEEPTLSHTAALERELVREAELEVKRES